MASGKEFDYKKAQLETWDFVVLAVYFVIVLIVGIMVSPLKATIPKSTTPAKKFRQPRHEVLQLTGDEQPV